MATRSEIPDANDAASRIERKLGLPSGFVHEIVSTDSDWAFVVKIHALLETALAQSISDVLGHPRLEKKIALLTFRQKSEWVDELHGIPKAGAQFLQAMSTLRNRLAHQVKNIPGFELGQYVRSMEPAQAKQLVGEWPETLAQVVDGKFVRVVLAITALRVTDFLEAAEVAHRDAREREHQEREDLARQLYRDAVLELLDKTDAESRPPRVDGDGDIEPNK